MPEGRLCETFRCSLGCELGCERQCGRALELPEVGGLMCDRERLECRGSADLRWTVTAYIKAALEKEPSG